MTKEKKYKYCVGLSAEGDTVGYVILTPSEAEIVQKATNTNNWVDVNFKSPYSGSFFIDIDNPIEIEEEI